MAANKAERQYRPRRRMCGHTVGAIAVMVVTAIAICAVYVSGNHAEKTDTIETTADKLKAVVIADTIPAETIEYEGFTVSFNAQAHIPNYVVWELTATEADADGKRISDFQADERIDGCPTIDDYRRSGYDRGHMAPAADMKWSEKAMADCHYLTNIAPQAKALNSGAWNTLEANCREWARRDSAIIVICGPVLSDKIVRHIGKTEVSVPERFFKVVLAPYASPPRGIGFIMPNARVVGGVQAAAVTIDEVEAVTGYDFFSALPDDIETVVESQCNYPLWQRKL